MANILYSVNGEGLGHATRAQEIIRYLREHGHKVIVSSYDRGYDRLSLYFPTTKIEGPGFVFKDNGILYLRTALKNIRRLPGMIKNLEILRSIINDEKIDLVTTDFEPAACWAAEITRKPILSIDNIHLVSHTKYSFPPRYWFEAILAKSVIRLLVPRAEHYFVMSFFPTEPRNKKTTVISPILRHEIAEINPSDAGHVLVYASADFNYSREMLHRLPNNFICYGFNRSDREDNIQFKQGTPSDFLTDLASSTAIIGSAGFSLMSEAFFLNKPFLAIPVKGHFEQNLNSIYLERMNFGLRAPVLNEQITKIFLNRLPEFKERLAGYPKHSNLESFDLINKRINLILEKS